MVPSTSTMLLRFLVSVAVLSTVRAAPPQFDADVVEKVRLNAISAAGQSWEFGTMMEAVIEHDSPHLGVFEAAAVPITNHAVLPVAVSQSLDQALSNQPNGKKYYFNTGAVGDSASIGVTALMAGIATSNSAYTTSAKNQLDYLLKDTPRQGNIISHRIEYFQAWADFVSMAPPFIAYSGVVSNSKSLLSNAYEQCKGYRSILQDPSTKLWRHIIGGPWNDTGIWATGNGWAAYGMLRVQQTIAKSQFASDLKSESADLLVWTNEILNATWTRQTKHGALDNYMDSKDQFEDSAGTALLAAATYRIASITQTDTNIPAAERALQRTIDLTDADGWLHGPVDPLNFGKQASGHSPEGQSFVLLLESASRAYYAAKSSTSSPAKNPTTPTPHTADSPSSSSSSSSPPAAPSSPLSAPSWADVIADVVNSLDKSTKNA